ncbi:MAG: amino acid adenylation domain-containing protein [Bacteroidetes bacterium]|nr:amino acid adenylation domain-containing protein [Bacteroidota bacterium]
MIFQHELERSLNMYSDRTAIEQGDVHMSYATLYAKALSVADWLLNNDLPLQTPVGIYMDDRASIIQAITGVSLVGMVFVPLDTALPVERLHAMVSRAGIKQVITCGNRMTSNLSALPVVCTLLEEIVESAAADKSPVTLPRYNSDDSLYIYYTSGSTGVPKGIVGRNAGLLQFVQWEINHFAIQPGCRFSQFISPYFDAFLRDVFTPLLSGGTICIPPVADDFFTTEKLTDWVDKNQINWIHCVPSIFRILNGNRLNKEMFVSLRYVLMSGERIVPSELVNWYNVFDSRIQLVNLYGATESTMVRTAYLIQPEDAHKAKIPIGKPIDDTWLAVLNKQMKPCKLLEPGDLYIVSDFISKGYVGEPELTQSKFISLTDDAGVQRKAYHTGDRARKLPDGTIDLLGREDRQIKLRGIRIELEEIENKLLAVPGVSQAVVIKHTDELGNEILAAFITGSATGELPLTALQEQTSKYLRERLPEYMVPACVVAMDAMPLLPNGKINLKKLPDYLLVAQTEPPATPTEEKLHSTWKEIIGDKEISVHDTFFKIGGNSLSVMRLISCIYREFSVRITLSEIFSNSTIRKQALLIDNAARQLSLKIYPAGRKEMYAVAASQQRLYFNYELDRNSAEYNMPMAWEISADVSQERIKEIVQQLIDRHESLRTSFHLDNGTLVQKISEHAKAVISTLEAPASDSGQALQEAVQPFDLSVPPLIRAVIVQHAGRKRTLLIDMHHIISDGISQSLLSDEFIRLYNGEILPAVEYQFKDYAEWEQAYRMGPDYQQHRAFWVKNFAGGIPVLQLPTTRNGDGLSTAAGEEWLLVMEKDSLRGLTDLCTDKMTLYSLFLAVYYAYMLQITGQHDFVIGVATSGRMQHEVKDVVGMFVKTLPVRYRIDENLTFAEFASALQYYLLEAYNHQAYDLADIAAAAGEQTSEKRELFSTVLALNNFAVFGEQAGEQAFRHKDIHTGKAKFPFYLVIDEAKDQFGFRFEYSQHYFTRNDIQLLASRFEKLIRNVATNPHEQIRHYISVNQDSTRKASKEDIVFNF